MNMKTNAPQTHRILNDWKPETRSLLKALVAAGFTLVEGDNGEFKFKFKGNLNKFIENLIACDEAHLYVTDPNGKRRWLWLILGNSPGEIASDYSVGTETPGVADPLDVVTQAHYDKWEGRKQPTIKADLSGRPL